MTTNLGPLQKPNVNMGSQSQEKRVEAITGAPSGQMSSDSKQVSLLADAEMVNKDPNQAQTEADEITYPTGIRLVLLAGASILGVFLISLDQVRPSRIPWLPFVCLHRNRLF